MNAITKLSAKGQVVIPKDVRDRLHWAQGTPLEVIDGPAGVMLRVPPSVRTGMLTAEESMARIHAISGYRGPRGSEADWSTAIAARLAKGEDPAS